MKNPPNLVKLMIAALALSAMPGTAQTINVKTLGAIGTGVVGTGSNDTAAFKAALLAVGSGSAAEIYVPSGTYRITEKLVLDRKASITIRGQARSNGTSPLAPAATTLLWDGTAGGTMLHTIGVRTCTIRDMNLDGNNTAGTLLLYTSTNGWGNILNRVSSLGFTNAAAGIQFGDDTSINICNSDVQMDFLFFSNLANGMLVKNSQGVDYLINYMFATNCQNVLSFEKGGNLTVNNAQMTDCNLFLNIVSAGITCGTFVANTVRVEASDAGVVKRCRLLKATQGNPAGTTPSNITFTGFTDAQWNWRMNTTVDRFKPLCEIGPEVSVTFQGSIFNSPLAEINGTSLGDACLVTRECAYIIGTPLSPSDFVSANQYGFFQLVNSRNKYKKLVADVVKWKPAPPVVISDPAYIGQGFISTTIP